MKEMARAKAERRGGASPRSWRSQACSREHPRQARSRSQVNSDAKMQTDEARLERPSGMLGWAQTGTRLQARPCCAVLSANLPPARVPFLPGPALHRASLPCPCAAALHINLAMRGLCVGSRAAGASGLAAVPAVVKGAGQDTQYAPAPGLFCIVSQGTTCSTWSQPPAKPQ